MTTSDIIREKADKTASTVPISLHLYHLICNIHHVILYRAISGSSAGSGLYFSSS